MALTKPKPTPIHGIKLRRIVRTCIACPSQWDTWEQGTGQYYYIRYRGGNFSVVRGAYTDPDYKVVFEAEIGDDLDGMMTNAQMLEHTGFVFTGKFEGEPDELNFDPSAFEDFIKWTNSQKKKK